MSFWSYVAGKIQPFIKIDIPEPEPFKARPKWIDVDFISIGGEDPDLGEGGETEYFVTEANGLAKLEGFIRVGKGGSWGGGDVYYFVPPVEYQPNPWTATKGLQGEATFYNKRPPNPQRVAMGTAEFHQIWYGDRRFGIRIFFPHDSMLNRPESDKTDIFKPRWPHSLREGDSIKFKVVYATSQLRPE